MAQLFLEKLRDIDEPIRPAGTFQGMGREQHHVFLQTAGPLQKLASPSTTNTTSPPTRTVWGFPFS
jgi:hypothetical protein